LNRLKGRCRTSNQFSSSKAKNGSLEGDGQREFWFSEIGDVEATERYILPDDISGFVPAIVKKEAKSREILNL
jgi:hypothetical protein